MAEASRGWQPLRAVVVENTGLQDRPPADDADHVFRGGVFPDPARTGTRRIARLSAPRPRTPADAPRCVPPFPLLLDGDGRPRIPHGGSLLALRRQDLRAREAG